MDQEGTGSIRFGLVRTNTFPGSTRFGLRCLNAAWFGPVRFGSFPRLVLAGSRSKPFGSVRPVRFGFLFLPDKLICPYLALSSKLCIQIRLNKDMEAYNQGAPNRDIIRTYELIQETKHYSQ